MIRTLTLAAAVTVALYAPHAVKACEPGCQYKTVTCYRTVSCLETCRVPYNHTVTRYDHCGRPVCETVVCYRDVQVSVTKQVPYTKVVKVCN